MLEAQTAAPMMGAVTADLDYRALGKLMDSYKNDPENLIMILQGVQRKYNYLPEPALKYISAKLAIPLSRIYGIATFYAMFSLEPKGENIISICLGTACHVRGAMRVKDQLEADLGITAGQTTPDAKFTLEAVRCIGCCSLGPVVNINDKTFARMDPESVIAALKDYK